MHGFAPNGYVSRSAAMDDPFARLHTDPPGFIVCVYREDGTFVRRYVAPDNLLRGIGARDSLFVEFFPLSVLEQDGPALFTKTCLRLRLEMETGADKSRRYRLVLSDMLSSAHGHLFDHEGLASQIS